MLAGALVALYARPAAAGTCGIRFDDFYRTTTFTGEGAPIYSVRFSADRPLDVRVSFKVIVDGIGRPVGPLFIPIRNATPANDDGDVFYQSEPFLFGVPGNVPQDLRFISVVGVHGTRCPR